MREGDMSLPTVIYRFTVQITVSLELCQETEWKPVKVFQYHSMEPFSSHYQSGSDCHVLNQLGASE